MHFCLFFFCCFQMVIVCCTLVSKVVLFIYVYHFFVFGLFFYFYKRDHQLKEFMLIFSTVVSKFFFNYLSVSFLRVLVLFFNNRGIILLIHCAITKEFMLIFSTHKVLIECFLKTIKCNNDSLAILLNNGMFRHLIKIFLQMFKQT